MQGSGALAKHFREIHFGENWTSVDLRTVLADITWNEAVQQRPGFNSIAALTYHIHYFVAAVLPVLEGGALDAHDRFSFDHPPITCAADWQQLCERTFSTAERFALLVEQLPDERLHAAMADPKYGTWYRNLHGIIEHTHYHLGQIVILKKLLRSAVTADQGR